MSLLANAVIADGAGTPVNHTLIERNPIANAKSYGIQYMESVDTAMELVVVVSYDETPATYTRKLVKVKGKVVDKDGVTRDVTVNHTYMLPKGVEDAALETFTVAANNVVKASGFDAGVVDGIA